MDLIFCGTPQFAVPTLEKLIEDNFNLKLVLTSPDEPRGRGHKLQPPPVKEAAQKRGIEVYQPARLRTPEVLERLRAINPDAIVVVAYGHIIPQSIIDLPRLGCINLHASLLPKYRGAAPISRAIIEGERETGVTTMKIDAGMDTGDMLLECREPIRPDDTAETLATRLSEVGASLMAETLRRLERGEITPRVQDSAFATYAPKLTKEEGRIDWSRPAEEIERRTRGFAPWPGAYTFFRGQRLHVWRAEPIARSEHLNDPPGTLAIKNGGLAVVCGSGTLLAIEEVQLEGRKRISAREFLNGARIKPGEILASD